MGLPSFFPPLLPPLLPPPLTCTTWLTVSTARLSSCTYLVMGSRAVAMPASSARFMHSPLYLHTGMHAARRGGGQHCTRGNEQGAVHQSTNTHIDACLQH